MKNRTPWSIETSRDNRRWRPVYSGQKILVNYPIIKTFIKIQPPNFFKISNSLIETKFRTVSAIFRILFFYFCLVCVFLLFEFLLRVCKLRTIKNIIIIIFIYFFLLKSTFIRLLTNVTYKKIHKYVHDCLKKS